MRWLLSILILMCSVAYAATSPIKYIFWIKMENHSFNDFFVTFPGAQNVSLTGKRSDGTTMALVHAGDAPTDCGHNWTDAHTAMHLVGGVYQMDQFDKEFGCGSSPYKAYVYHTQADIPQLWSLATTYSLSDNFFQDLAGESYPNHLYSDAATSDQIINNPAGIGTGGWGCRTVGQTAPAERPDLTTYNHTTCFDVTTIQDQLDAAAVPWLYYTPNVGTPGYHFGTLSSIAHIFNGPEWATNVKDYSTFSADVTAGNLPLTKFFAQIIPDSVHNQHPVASISAGDTWLGQQISAIKNSIYWQNSLIVVTWDDWGGFYDPLPPPQTDFYGLGPRVPLLVVSPFAKTGYISHVQTSPSSILAQIEHTFGVACLTTRDCTANDLSDMLVTQPWAGVLDPTRAIDWSSAGTGTIPVRNCAANLTSTATLAQINSAIASAAANTAVCLGAGNYPTYNGQIINNNKPNVTLRGAGANATFLTFATGGNGNGLGAVVYATNADSNYSGDPHNVCNWTAGYAQNTTAITLGTCPVGSLANLKVGTLLIHDQLDDATDTGGMIVCQTQGAGLCTTQGASGANGGRPGRAQTQQVVVTAINGSSVNISPGLYASNWSAGKTPQVWFSSAIAATGVGFENMSIDVRSVPESGSVFMFNNAVNSWVTGVRSLNSTQHKHVWLYQSSHVTVRNNYFYGSQGASESYGADSAYASSDNLIENNICQHVATCTIVEDDTGSVFAYNYAIDNFFNTAGFQQLDASKHGAFDNFTLWEGNQGSGFSADNTHGYSFGLTLFRNRYSGLDVATGTKTAQTLPVQVWMGNRYVNLIGNIVGLNTLAATYQTNPASSTDCGTINNTSVFTLGWSQTEATRAATLGTCPSGLGAPFNLFNDTSVVTNIMRWGNYDTVSNANRFVSAEVPSGITPYGNAVPVNNTLPPSFYLTARPPFWGNIIPWPSNGPDLSGGNIANVAGHASNNPAANCYLNIMLGVTNGVATPVTFDPLLCYGVATTQTIYRPTVFIDTGVSQTGGTNSMVNTTFAYDGNPLTSATGTATHDGTGQSLWNITYYGFPVNVGVTPRSVVLNVTNDWSVIPSSGTIGGVNLEYSLNGGSTYTTLFVGQSHGPTTDTVVLPVTQDFSQVRVHFFSAGCSPPNCTQTGHLTETWISTQTVPSRLQGKGAFAGKGVIR